MGTRHIYGHAGRERMFVAKLIADTIEFLEESDSLARRGGGVGRALSLESGLSAGYLEDIYK